jgi:L-aminopeptidase/D-esterase-like protein
MNAKQVKITNDNLDLVPKLSTSNNKIELQFDDVKISQVEYTEGPVGLTYVHFVKGAKVYMDVRGGWPGYINALTTNDRQKIDGINISGGSDLGLESGTGITAESLKQNQYRMHNRINSSVIYSQNFNKNRIYPDKQLGRFAYNNLNNILYNGQVGAGQSAFKGQGWCFKKVGKIKILGLVVNNAIGEIFINNKKIKTNSMNIPNINLGMNTTITVLITNLKLDNDELKQLSHQVHCSMAETIRPFNTFFDGDTFYACSTETLKKTKELNSKKLMKLYMIFSDVIKNAILKSVNK